MNARKRAASRYWVRQTVKLAAGYFDLVAEMYWEPYQRSGAPPKEWEEYMDEVRRQLSICIRERWLPQPKPFKPDWEPDNCSRSNSSALPKDYDEAFLLEWYQKKCGPAVEDMLTAKARQWKSHAVSRDDRS